MSFSANNNGQSPRLGSRQYSSPWHAPGGIESSCSSEAGTLERMAIERLEVIQPTSPSSQSHQASYLFMDENASLEERTDAILYYYSSCGVNHEPSSSPHHQNDKPLRKKHSKFNNNVDASQTRSTDSSNTEEDFSNPIHSFSWNSCHLAKENFVTSSYCCFKNDEDGENNIENPSVEAIRHQNRNMENVVGGDSDEAASSFVSNVQAEDAAQFTSFCHAMQSFVDALAKSHPDYEFLDEDQHDVKQPEQRKEETKTIICNPILETVHLTSSTIVSTLLEETLREDKQKEQEQQSKKHTHDLSPVNSEGVRIMCHCQYIRQSNITMGHAEGLFNVHSYPVSSSPGVISSSLGRYTNGEPFLINYSSNSSLSFVRLIRQWHSLYRLLHKGNVYYKRNHKELQRRFKNKQQEGEQPSKSENLDELSMNGTPTTDGKDEKEDHVSSSTLFQYLRHLRKRERRLKEKIMLERTQSRNSHSSIGTGEVNDDLDALNDDLKHFHVEERKLHEELRSVQGEIVTLMLKNSSFDTEQEKLMSFYDKLVKKHHSLLFTSSNLNGGQDIVQSSPHGKMHHSCKGDVTDSNKPLRLLQLPQTTPETTMKLQQLLQDWFDDEGHFKWNVASVSLFVGDLLICSVVSSLPVVKKGVCKNDHAHTVNCDSLSYHSETRGLLSKTDTVSLFCYLKSILSSPSNTSSSKCDTVEIDKCGTVVWMPRIFVPTATTGTRSVEKTTTSMRVLIYKLNTDCCVMLYVPAHTMENDNDDDNNNESQATKNHHLSSQKVGIFVEGIHQSLHTTFFGRGDVVWDNVLTLRPPKHDDPMYVVEPSYSGSSSRRTILSSSSSGTTCDDFCTATDDAVMTYVKKKRMAFIHVNTERDNHNTNASSSQSLGMISSMTKIPFSNIVTKILLVGGDKMTADQRNGRQGQTLIAALTPFNVPRIVVDDILQHAIVYENNDIDDSTYGNEEDEDDTSSSSDTTELSALHSLGSPRNKMASNASHSSTMSGGGQHLPAAPVSPTCSLETCYLLPRHNVWISIRSSSRYDQCLIIDCRMHKTVKHVQDAWSQFT